MLLRPSKDAFLLLAFIPLLSSLAPPLHYSLNLSTPQAPLKIAFNYDVRQPRRYAGTGDRLMDGTYGYDAIAAAHEIAPHKVLLATEGCSCPGVELGSVLRAERLGHDVMFDMLNWAQGWIDWNLLVDSEGGPNHLGNNCDAPIITTPDFSDIVIQPKYHYFGHFSKFVEPGSVRIESSVVGSYGFAITDPNVRAGMKLWSLYIPTRDIILCAIVCSLDGCRLSSTYFSSLN